MFIESNLRSLFVITSPKNSQLRSFGLRDTMKHHATIGMINLNFSATAAIILAGIKFQIVSASDFSKRSNETSLLSKVNGYFKGERKITTALGNKIEFPAVPPPKSDHDTSFMATCYIYKNKDAKGGIHTNKSSFLQHPEKAPLRYVPSRSTGKG